MRSEILGKRGREHCAANLAESLGVVRHRTETYSVGGFRYANPTDAIAQARRGANPKQAIG